MFCDLHNYSPYVELSLLTVLNIIGTLLNIISLINIITNDIIEQLLRAILLSFITGNTVGTSMLVYDTIFLSCKQTSDSLDGIDVSLTMFLSCAHIILLLLAEHLSLVAGCYQRTRDFCGLLMFVWIFSITGIFNQLFSSSYPSLH